MNDKIIARYNEFLSAELAAVETYAMAIKQTRHNEFTTALQQLRDAHDQRVTPLRNKIREHAGAPTASTGVWGAWSKVVQAGADLLGSTTAIAALEQGEDHLVKLYTGAMTDENPEIRQYVTTTLLPAQQKSHDTCRSLKRFIKSAA
jgi:demethoxyubiquinone hydroxylase (CLK1/Coq7/Cat5 family)